MLLVTLGLIAAGCGGGRRPRGVILISLDTLAADHLKSYGYERDTAPGIDRWLARGARFETCMAAADWTLPSHMSMLTGVRPWRHGVIDHSCLDGPAVPLVSQVLQHQGIATAAFVQHTNVSRLFGFGRGFDTFSQVEESARFQDPQAVLVPAGKWLRAQSGTPFFAFIHVFAIHWPHLQPEPFRSRFDPGYKGTIQGVQVDVNRLMGERLTEQDQRDFQHLRALYDGNISWVDEQVSRFLDELDAAIDLDDVLVILTADHGEAFKEHGYYGHGISFQREEINVPLGLIWPAHIKPGQSVAGLASGIDLPRTILAAFGLKTDAIEGDGVDLIGALTHGLPQRPLVSESSLGMNQLHFDRLSLVNDGYKYIAFPAVTRFEARFGEALYDLRQDPLEKTNLIAARPRITERFRSMAREQLGYTDEEAFLVMFGPLEEPATLDVSAPGGFATFEVARFASELIHGGGRAPDWVTMEPVEGKPDMVRLRASASTQTNAVFLVPMEPAARLRLTPTSAGGARGLPEMTLYGAGPATAGARPIATDGVSLAELETVALDPMPPARPGEVALAKTNVLAHPADAPVHIDHLPDSARRQLEHSGYLGGPEARRKRRPVRRPPDSPPESRIPARGER